MIDTHPTMTFRELINHVLDRGYFNKTINYIHAVDINLKDKGIDAVFKAYTNVTRELLDLPGSNELDGHVIHVDNVMEDGVEYSHVTLFDDNEQYALDFVDWNDLIDLPIKDKTSTEVSEMLAHVLHEITWWGFTCSSILQQGEELLKSGLENTIEFPVSGLDFS